VIDKQASIFEEATLYESAHHKHEATVVGACMWFAFKYGLKHSEGVCNTDNS